MEAPQRTVPGQQPGLVNGQPQLPVFNHMLSNHQVGHGPWNNPYGQVGGQHQTLQREVVMETGGSRDETAKAAVGYGGTISWVLTFMAVTSMLCLKALGGGTFRREVRTLQEKVKQIPTLFTGLSQSDDPYMVTPEKSELVILKDASPTRKEPIKVESETLQETKPERPEKLEEPEAYVEMDGRLLSLDQLCQEIGARRVHSPRSSATASDEVVVEDLGVSPVLVDSLEGDDNSGHELPPPDPPVAEAVAPVEPAAAPAAASAPRKWRGGRRREVKPEAILEEAPQAADEPAELPEVVPSKVEEPPPETREERVARLLAEMEAEDWSWGGGQPKAAHDGRIYFAGLPGPAAVSRSETTARSVRTWRAGGGGSVASSKATVSYEDPALLELEARLEEGTFMTAKALRCRPTGCFVRLAGGREAFLPVEHMLPRTEASTNAVRATVTKAGNLRVRDIGSDRVSMLKALDEAAKGQELEARRRKMEQGIEHLRENYNPNKVMMGFVSSVQKNGVFVSVIDGQDALIPIKELPQKFLEKDGEAALKPTLEVGQAVHFRIIRYSWQTDGFTASMLPLETRSRTSTAPAGAPRYQQEELVERAPSPDRSASAKVWAAKGYSVITNEAAMELNQWLKSKMEDKKSKKGSKAVLKTTVTYLVSIARGMNTKAVGSIDLEKNVSEKEVKQAAVELLQKDGHLKAGEQHKGVTITKNIISVKL